MICIPGEFGVWLYRQTVTYETVACAPAGEVVSQDWNIENSLFDRPKFRWMIDILYPANVPLINHSFSDWLFY
jgi:hypothetical protein